MVTTFAVATGTGGGATVCAGSVFGFTNRQNARAVALVMALGAFRIAIENQIIGLYCRWWLGGLGGSVRAHHHP